MTTTVDDIRHRLRRVRIQQGLSLVQAAGKSEGRYKVSAIGSYERGDRALTLDRLAGLADLYGVPIEAIIGDRTTDRVPRPSTRIVVNLVRLGRLGGDAGDTAAPVRRWVEHIQRVRDDYANNIISIRGDDLPPLAVALGVTPGQLRTMMNDWGLIDPRGRDQLTPPLALCTCTFRWTPGLNPVCWSSPATGPCPVHTQTTTTNA